MAATEPRNTPIRDFRLGELSFPVADGYQIWKGTLVQLNASGRLVPGSADTGICAGVAQESVLGTALLPQCKVMCCIAQFGNHDSIDQTDVGTMASILDDVSVSQHDNSQNDAGKIVAVDANGVWVSVGLL